MKGQKGEAGTSRDGDKGDRVGGGLVQEVSKKGSGCDVVKINEV